MLKTKLAKITERLIHVRCDNKLSILFCFMQGISENQLTLFRPMEFSIKFDTLCQDGPLYILKGHRL